MKPFLGSHKYSLTTVGGVFEEGVEQEQDLLCKTEDFEKENDDIKRFVWSAT